MDLAAFRKDRRITQAALAALLTDAGSPATQGLISQWEGGKAKVPAERVSAIETATGGLVTRHDLRPDLFGHASAEAA